MGSGALGPSRRRPLVVPWPDLTAGRLHRATFRRYIVLMNNNTALLVIDIQDSFRIDPKRWASRSNPRFEENVTELIRTFRDASLPVIWIGARAN